MAYIGKSPPTSGKDAGASFDIDDISGEFNGSTTAFDIEVGGTALSPTTTNVFIFLGGVLQHPGDAYTVSGSQIAFTAAPDSGVSFHGTILGHTRTITPDQGTVADSSFAASAITAISGSFTAVSSSLASRISSEEGEAEGSVISSSAQIAADISGSITSTSSSIATRFDSRETDMTLATASIAAITASISTAKTDISTNTSNMTLATASIAAITASVSSIKTDAFAGTAGTETVFSGSATSTGSFGSIYTDKNVNASAFVGDGSSLTGIDIPTAAAISGSVVSGVSGSAASTGSFGRVEANNVAYPPRASGGIESYYTGYKVHTFLADPPTESRGWPNEVRELGTSGSFVVHQDLICDILCVAGGGGGGRGKNGSGGGAGGMIVSSSVSVPVGIYTTVVGFGGKGGWEQYILANFAQTTGSHGSNGSNSSIDTTPPSIAIGGGGGVSNGRGSDKSGASGGSGGGCSKYGSGGAGTTGQGNAGESSPVGSSGESDGISATGGGGGAGEAGGADGDRCGGDGLQNDFRTGFNVYYAGGGSGTEDGRRADIPGGLGGGGLGSTADNGAHAIPHTGGGGGGGGENAAWDGGDGGSGIIVIRYVN